MTERQANRAVERVRDRGFTANVHYDARAKQYYIFVHENRYQGQEYLRTVTETLDFLADYGATS